MLIHEDSLTIIPPECRMKSGVIYHATHRFYLCGKCIIIDAVAW